MQPLAERMRPRTLEDYIGQAKKIIELNETIANDSALGQGFCIGHSYLCNPESSIKSIVKYDLIPLIEEYWFDNESEQKQHIATLEELIKW